MNGLVVVSILWALVALVIGVVVGLAIQSHAREIDRRYPSSRRTERWVQESRARGGRP